MQSSLLRIHVPGNGDGVGLVAVGGIGDVHEACLHWKNELSTTWDGSDNVGDQALSTRDIFEAANPLRPNRLKFEYMRQTGTFAPPGEKKTRLSLIPVVSGDWLVGRLLTANDVVCGAVMWNPDKVGVTAEGAARAIQRDICVEGGAGMYNANEETNEFLARGGRIVGRYSWEDGGPGPLNNALPEDSPYKLTQTRLDERFISTFGQDFLFALPGNYLDGTWNDIKDLPGTGIVAGQDGPNPRVWAIGDPPTAVRAYFERQEYLAGRLLTTDIAVSSDAECSTKAAVHLILLFTYASPEQLDDATVEGHLISRGVTAAMKTPEGFLSYVIQDGRTKEDLETVLRSISCSKIMELLEDGVVRNDKASVTDRVQMARMMIPVMYSEPLPSAPSLVGLHSRILIYLMDFELLEAFLLALRDVDALETLATEVQEKVDAAPDKYQSPAPPHILLALAPTAQCADALLNAGIRPTVKALSGSMDRLTVFQYLWDKLKEDPATDAEDAARALAVEAVRGRHSAALDIVLSGMTPSSLRAVAASSDFDILGPPDPDQIDGAPPVSKGTLGQVATGCFVVSSFFQQKLAPWRKDLEIDALREVMAVMERQFTGVSREHYFNLQTSFWDEMLYVARYDLARDEVIANSKTHISKLIESFDHTSIQISNVGRLEAEIRQQEQNSQASSSASRIVDVAAIVKHWYMESARKVTDVYVY